MSNVDPNEAAAQTSVTSGLSGRPVTVAGLSAGILGAIGYVYVSIGNVQTQAVSGSLAGNMPSPTIAAGVLAGRNAVIDGNFAINQRTYVSGTALTAGTYAHDRWKAGASGCTYTFSQTVPDTTVTITNGSLEQAVDGPNVYSASMLLEWQGGATARVWQNTPSGSFSAGTAYIDPIDGAKNKLLVTGLTPGTPVNVEFQGGTVGLVQLEAATPTPDRFERRHGELTLAQRYYQTNGFLYGFASSSTQVVVLFNPLTAMRTLPGVTLLTTSPAIESPPTVTGYTGSASTIIGTHATAVGAFDLVIGGFSGLTPGTIVSFKPQQLAISAEL